MSQVVLERHLAAWPTAHLMLISSVIACRIAWSRAFTIDEENFPSTYALGERARAE